MQENADSASTPKLWVLSLNGFSSAASLRPSQHNLAIYHAMLLWYDVVHYLCNQENYDYSLEPRHLIKWRDRRINGTPIGIWAPLELIERLYHARLPSQRSTINHLRAWRERRHSLSIIGLPHTIQSAKQWLTRLNPKPVEPCYWSYWLKEDAGALSFRFRYLLQYIAGLLLISEKNKGRRHAFHDTFFACVESCQFLADNFSRVSMPTTHRYRVIPQVLPDKNIEEEREVCKNMRGYLAEKKIKLTIETQNLGNWLLCQIHDLVWFWYHGDTYRNSPPSYPSGSGQCICQDKGEAFSKETLRSLLPMLMLEHDQYLHWYKTEAALEININRPKWYD